MHIFKQTLTKHSVIALSISLLLSIINTAFAIDPIYNTGSKDLAIRGYDTVAYFTQGEALKGLESISHNHKGATWRFTNEKHKQLFIENPEKYEPQYGGYCAYAISRGTTASIKPKLFKIHNGKLYLNYNANVQKKWLNDIDERIATADKNWPKLLTE